MTEEVEAEVYLIFVPNPQQYEEISFENSSRRATILKSFMREMTLDQEADDLHPALREILKVPVRRGRIVREDRVEDGVEIVGLDNILRGRIRLYREAYNEHHNRNHRFSFAGPQPSNTYYYNDDTGQWCRDSYLIEIETESGEPYKMSEPFVASDPDGKELTATLQIDVKYTPLDPR